VVKSRLAITYLPLHFYTYKIVQKRFCPIPVQLERKNVLMVFGDAKKVIEDMVKAVE